MRSLLLPASRGRMAASAFALLATACSASLAPASSSSTQDDGGMSSCVYPSGVQVSADPQGSGCFGSAPSSICQASDASSGDDGSSSADAESCQPLCGPSEFELTCQSGGAMGNIPTPDSAWNCTVIPVPTPSGVLFYCCPCAG